MTELARERGFNGIGLLENEKYYGAALLQKTITVNFLTHKRTENKGQSQKYMIDENHLPIIDKEIFDLAIYCL